jgi:RNA polymerase sigma factor (sigma-70 family)
MRTEDGHIIRRCLNGEPEAFGFLVDKYKGAIYAFAYTKLRNFHDAEDVTQEVFINAYRKLRSLRRWDNFHAWIYAITSNLCRNWVRTRANRPDGEYTEDQDPETLDKRSESSYREELMHESLYESLNEALAALPEGYRQVLTLYYLGGMSGDEIARFLGTSPSNVRQRLSRARSRLKEEMIAMMSTTLEAKRLAATFTFRVVEAVKRVRIHPVPRATGLPWGLSLAAGIMVTVLSLSPHLSIPIDVAIPAGNRGDLRGYTQDCRNIGNLQQGRG